MSNLIIELSINNMSEGYLYLYDEDRGGEIELEVELEFEYDAEEKETIDCPRVHEELRLLSVNSQWLGSIEIDSIQNLDKFNKKALECMHKEGLEP